MPREPAPIPGMGRDILLYMRLDNTPKLFCPFCSKQYVRSKDLMKHIVLPDRNHPSTSCQTFPDVPGAPVQTFGTMYSSPGNQGLSQQPNQNNSFGFEGNFTRIAPSNQMRIDPSDPVAFPGMYGATPQQHPQELVSYSSSGPPAQQTNTFSMAPASYTAGGSMEESIMTDVGAASNEIDVDDINRAGVPESYGLGGDYPSNWEASQALNFQYWGDYQQEPQNASEEATSNQ